MIPYIADEEPKLERELNKMLGHFDGHGVVAAPFAVSAHVNRVAVEHGHLACLSVELARRVPLDQIGEVIASWTGDPVACGLPSSPERAIQLTTRPDRRNRAVM